MSSSSELLTEPTRRELSARQGRTVQGLTEAAIDELRSTGYDGMTVRNVARRAGVAAATAYTYFASKEHLVTEAYWRRIATLPDPRVDRRRGPSARVTAALADITKLANDEPELVAACTVAMMADDPDVRHLRDRIGQVIHERFVAALGEDADRAVLRALDLAMTGALVRAGTGHMSYSDIPVRIAEVATLMLEPRS
ncbi:MAG: TetR family transcriptional regulator [Actinomycetota bacterium]